MQANFCSIECFSFPLYGRWHVGFHSNRNGFQKKRKIYFSEHFLKIVSIESNRSKKGSFEKYVTKNSLKERPTSDLKWQRTRFQFVLFYFSRRSRKTSFYFEFGKKLTAIFEVVYKTSHFFSTKLPKREAMATVLVRHWVFPLLCFIVGSVWVASVVLSPRKRIDSIWQLWMRVENVCVFEWHTSWNLSSCQKLSKTDSRPTGSQVLSPQIFMMASVLAVVAKSGSSLQGSPLSLSSFLSIAM